MDKKRDLSITECKNAKDTLDTAKYAWMLCIKNSTWKSFSGKKRSWMFQEVASKGIQFGTISRPTAYGEYAPILY